MSISLKKEQGFYFMEQTSLKTPIPLKKGLNVHFRVMRDGKNVHLA